MMAPTLKDFLNAQSQEQIDLIASADFGALSNRQRIEFLKEALLRGKPAPRVTASILEALLTLGCNDRYFFRKFEYHRDPEILRLVNQALGKSGGTDVNNGRPIHSLTNLSVQDLLALLLHEERLQVRKEIITILTERPDLDESWLLAAIEHAVWHIRAAIIDILGQRGSSAILGIAARLCKDTNVDVRLALVTALGRLSRDQALPFLQALAKDNHIRVRREASQKLGNSGR